MHILLDLRLFDLFFKIVKRICMTLVVLSTRSNCEVKYYFSYSGVTPLSNIEGKDLGVKGKNSINGASLL